MRKQNYLKQIIKILNFYILYMYYIERIFTQQYSMKLRQKPSLIIFSFINTG